MLSQLLLVQNYEKNLCIACPKLNAYEKKLCIACPKLNVYGKTMYCLSKTKCGCKKTMLDKLPFCNKYSDGWQQAIF